MIDWRDQETVWSWPLVVVAVAVGGAAAAGCVGGAAMSDEWVLD